MSLPGQPQPPCVPYAPEPSPAPPRERLAGPRAWLRSRAGRVVVPMITLLLGIGIGVVGLFLYTLLIATDGQVLVTPLPPPGRDIVVQVGAAYITRILRNDLHNLGPLGDIEHVQVTLADSDRIHYAEVKVTGDGHPSLLGIRVTTSITLKVQLFVRDCQIQVNVLRADMGAFPLTEFATAFEGQIAQQLQVKTNGLPPGFTYCVTSVRTKPEGLFVTLSATPTVRPEATPTVRPAVTPTATPAATPTVRPAATPTATVRPVATPTATPTVRPMATPTVRPMATPTVRPAATPTVRPAATPK